MFNKFGTNNDGNTPLSYQCVLSSCYSLEPTLTAGHGGEVDDAGDNGGGRRRRGAGQHVQPARERPAPRQ